LLTAKQLSEATGLSQSQISTLARKGVIPFHDFSRGIGTERKRVSRRFDLKKVLEATEKTPLLAPAPGEKWNAGYLRQARMERAAARKAARQSSE